MPSLHLHTLTRHYPPAGGISGISLDVPAGEYCTIVGPSGAGKTTLLRLIAGLETPDAGQIQFDDRDVTRTEPHERHTAFVAQKPALYPHLNVADNLAAGVRLRQGRHWWGRRIAPVSSAELAARVAEAADWLGLTPLLPRRIQELSGGEAQRVVLGRAVVSRHPLWLLDEPLVHLDPATRAAVRAELLLIHGRLRPTIIEVTHDPLDALTVGSRVAVLAAGKIEQVGSPAGVYGDPLSRVVASSLGWPPMNFITGSKTPGTREGPLVFRAHADGDTLGVRPEDVRLGSGECDLGQWRLVRIDPLGPHGLWTVRQDNAIWQRWGQPGDVPADEMVLHAAAERCRWFDRTTGRRLER